MHIVHVLTRFERAGTEENTALTCNGQVRAGHRVTLVHGSAYNEEAFDLLDPAVERAEVPSLVRSISPVADTKAVISLVRLFRRLKADLVHTHQSKAGVVGRLAAVLAGVPRVVHGVHILAFMNVPETERWVYLGVERLAAPFTHAFIHVTPALKAECLAAGIGKAETHFVVPSGMKVEAFIDAVPPVDEAALRRPIPGQAAPPLILLLVSSLEPRKRPLPFLDVFAGVVADYPNVRLLIAGEGPERPALLAAIARLGLEDHVVLLGSRKDIPSLIKLADACMLASEREGLPRAVIQYALGGRPIVAPDLPDMERLLVDGRNGFVFPVDDLGAMRAPLVRLLSDEALRRRMGEASGALDLSDWADARMCERIEQIYAEVDRRIAAAA